MPDREPHSPFPPIVGAKERAITLETGKDDRVANMYAFTDAALKLLAQSLG